MTVNNTLKFINELGMPVEEYQAQLAKIEKLRIADLIPFQGQRLFKAYSEDSMNLLVDDIKANGVLHPIVVRRACRTAISFQYEILSGHNRVVAAKRAGFNWIMCNIVDVNDNQATLIYVNANLRNRKITMSERAFAYALRDEVSKTEKLQGSEDDKYNDLLNTDSALNDLTNTETESRQTIYYYLRISKLIQGLHVYGDNGAFSLLAGVNVSFLTVPEQETLLVALSEMSNPQLTLEMSKMLRRASESGEMTIDRVKQILTGEKPHISEGCGEKPKLVSFISHAGKDISRYIKKVSKKRELNETETNALFNLLKKTVDDYFSSLDN